MHRTAIEYVSILLTNDQKELRIDAHTELRNFAYEDENFSSKVITAS